MPVQKKAVNRFVLICSCALFACSLDVRGTGPAAAGDDSDPIHELDPIVAAPAAAPVLNPPSVIAMAPGSTPVAVTKAAEDAGVLDSDEAGTTIVITQLAAAADAGGQMDPATPTDPPPPSVFTLESSAFDDGAPLPNAFTCKAADQSPPLSWIHPPADTKSFSLVLTAKAASKPNAVASVEWVVWGIPATRSMLPRGVAAGSQPSNLPGTRQDASAEANSGAGGFTGFGGTLGVGVANLGGSWGVSVGTTGAPYYPTDTGTPPRYHGPCGTSAVTYEFTLFALDATATAQWGPYVSIATVTQWIKTRSNVLAQASLSATYP